MSRTMFSHTISRFNPLNCMDMPSACFHGVRNKRVSYDDAHDRAVELQEETGMTFIHPYDDELVIAGQGTIGLEILDQLPDVDAVIVPVGGGGLISGVAFAIKSLRPDVKVYGVPRVRKRRPVRKHHRLCRSSDPYSHRNRYLQPDGEVPASEQGKGFPSSAFQAV